MKWKIEYTSRKKSERNGARNQLNQLLKQFHLNCNTIAFKCLTKYVTQHLLEHQLSCLTLGEWGEGLHWDFGVSGGWFEGNGFDDGIEESEENDFGILMWWEIKGKNIQKGWSKYFENLKWLTKGLKWRIKRSKNSK